MSDLNNSDSSTSSCNPYEGNLGFLNGLEDDPYVLVFAKILKNECEEDFYAFQTYTESTVESIIKELLKEKLHGATVKQIEDKWLGVFEGNLDSYLWKNILERLFEPQTCELITQRVLNRIHENRKKDAYATPLQLNVNIHKRGYTASYSPARSTSTPGRNKLIKPTKSMNINYNCFLKLILNFQLEKHLKMIEPIYL